MSGLSDFRAKNPQYNDMSDKDLSDALYTKYYSDIPRDQFDKQMGTPVERESGAVSLLQQDPNKVVPESKMAEFGVGLSRPIANMDRFTAAALKKIGIDTGGAQRYSNYNAKINDMQRTGEIAPGTVAEGAGEMVGTAPVALITKRPLLNSAISSALSTNASTPSGVAMDAGIGAVAGKGADIGLRGAGAVIAPKVNSFVQKLLDKGVDLTPGQIAGGTIHRIEDASTSLNLPFVAQAQKRSLESFNKSVVNEGLGRIGTKLPNDIRAGHDSVDFAQGKFDDAYDKVIPQLTLKKDGIWTADNGNLKSLASQGLGADHLKKFNTLAKLVDSKFSANGTMSGESMKDLEETLRKEYQNYGKGGPADRDYADSIRELQAQVRDLAERTNPKQARALQSINSGYAMLTRAEGAARDAPEGVFTPGQFRKSVVNMDPSTRKRAAAAGNALLQDLAVAGEKVLPRTVNDSGTATRMLTQGAVGTALFGGAGLAHVNPLGITALAAALLPYTKQGQKIAGHVMSEGVTGVADPAINKFLPRGVASKTIAVRRGAASATRRGLQEAAPYAAKATSIAETEHRNTNLQENR